MQPPPRQRTAEEERARAAAKQAEKELWERTRGAGSAVFKLAEAGRIKPRSRNQAPSSPSDQRTHDAQTSSSNGASHVSATGSQNSSTSSLDTLDSWTAEDVLPTLEEVEAKLYEPVDVPSADVLLSRGICDYTLLPKTLGRGKFSTVFVASQNGELTAIKHTALFPHHQLIATRLLREPTLLAELPPHPNLVNVKETIRTPGHFYLVEEYLDGYVTLEALLPMLCPTQPHILPQPAAERILTQLLSAVHAIHVPLQICHRDIKPENILVHPETLQLKLLDFGLATHFSKSEPKLSTCCGSPAFHCPEIVKALASPQGSVLYMGPEVDAWTCGVTMLRCLTGARFPLGASHSSLRGMAIRAQRAVASIGDAKMREKVGALLDMDARRRMKRFDDLVKEQERASGDAKRTQKKFKSTTFIPAVPTHSIKLPILEPLPGQDAHPSSTSGFVTPVSASRRTTPSNSRAPSPSRSAYGGSSTNPQASLVALNPTNQPPERVISFVKYCLRCAGILYHTWPDYSGIAKSHKPSFFSPHASHPTTSVSAAFAEAVGLPLDAMTTPSTPLFPPSMTGYNDRADGYGHVQVFQCVVELPEEKENKDNGSQGQLSLVQSIMAAFGRKPTPSFAPPISRQQPTKASSPSPRPTGKRSMSTPAQSRPGADRAGSSAKDGSVRCLTFHLIVRFPKQPQSMVRQAVSRASSSLGQPQVQPAWGTRSRASSAAGALSQDISENEEYGERPDRRGGSPGLEPRKHVAISEDVSGANQEGQSSSQQPFPRAANNRSPSTSRPASRTRKRSSRGFQRRAKVLFQVTDERALPFVREAMSVGGTIDAHELDEGRTTHGPLDGYGNALAETSEQAAARNERRARRRVRDTSSLQNKAWPTQEETDATPGSPKGAANEEREDEDEPRGRSLTSGRTRHASSETIVGQAVGSIRAPSQLSTVALKEESPANDDLRQTIDSLTQTLSELVSIDSPTSSTHSPAVRSARSSSRPDQAEGPPPSYDGRHEGMLAQTRSLLLDVSGVLQRADRRGKDVVEETISPISFALFAALSPALGLLPTETIGLPATSTAPEEASEATTLRGLAMSSLELVARHASPREIFLALQERMEILGTRSSLNRPKKQQDDQESLPPARLKVDIPASGPTSSQLQSQSKSQYRPWLASLEIAGLLHVASVVAPRIKTKNPLNFIEPLVTLVPRSARGALQADVPHVKANDPSPSYASPTTSDRSSAEESPARQRDVAHANVEMAACEITLEVVGLCRSVLEWAQDVGDEVASSARAMVLTLFYSSMIALLPELPRPERQTHLSEWYFHHWMPRYKITRSEGEHARQSVRLPTINVLSSHVWTQLAELIEKLQINVESQAFERSGPMNEGDAATTAVQTMGAFMLHVNMLARQSSNTSTAVSEAHEGRGWGADWSAEVALAKLQKSMGLLVACLGSDPPATISKDGMQSLGGSAHLPDVALTWVMWCVEGMCKGDVRLGAEDAIVFVQAISAHAALCPRPTARHISMLVVHTTLHRLTDEAIARDLLHDLVIESPYPQLRAASVGMARTLIDDDLDAVAGVTNKSAGRRFAAPEFIDRLAPTLFVIPDAAEGLPALQKEGSGSTQDVQRFVGNIKSYTEDDGAWLSECLAFVYLLVSKDKTNVTGMRRADRLQSIEMNLLDPMHEWLQCCQQTLQSVSDDMSDSTEVGLALSMLEVALDRAKGAVKQAQAA